MTILLFCFVIFVYSAPQTAPLSLRPTVTKALSITVTWSPLDCADQRGTIESYTLYYGPADTYSNSRRMSVGDIMNTTHVVTGLTPESSYSFQVAAVNTEGLVGPLHPIINVITAAPCKFGCRSTKLCVECCI